MNKNKVKSRRKKNTKWPRRSSNGLTRRRRTHKKRRFVFGGFKNGYTCESEGCVFYPSIINSHDANQSVTKIYKSKKIFDKEVESYKLFDTIDPDYNYHCRILGLGTIHFNDFKDKMPGENMFNNTDYNYLDIEYAGKSIIEIDDNENTSCFKRSLIDFFKAVINLRDRDGSYIIHADPHSGNICYTMNTDTMCPIIKYIDITSVSKINPTEIIEANTDITRQFSSIIGTFALIFNYILNPLVTALSTITKSAPGKQYSVVIEEINEILNNVNLDAIVNASNPTDNTDSNSRVSNGRVSKKRVRSDSDNSPIGIRLGDEEVDSKLVWT